MSTDAALARRLVFRRYPMGLLGPILAAALLVAVLAVAVRASAGLIAVLPRVNHLPASVTLSVDAALVLGFAVATAVAVVLLRRRHAAKHLRRDLADRLCLYCGYALAGLEDLNEPGFRCPECGNRPPVPYPSA